MVRGTLIAKKHLVELLGNPKAKDKLLCNTYNITEDELSAVRHDSPLERAVKAAILLRDHNLAKQINSTILPAIAYREWDNPKQHTKRIDTALIQRFGKLREERIRIFGFRVPYIQLLREEIGAYNGNLYEARNVWQHFIPGPTDWLRSIKIPTSIDDHIAELLGIYWGDGWLNQNDESSAFVSAASLSGNKNDFDFYIQTIAPRIQDMHGIEVPVKSYKINVGKFRDSIISADPQSKYPAICIGSQGIASWLRDDIGLAMSKVNVELPKTYDEWSDHIAYAFFRGILAAMGNIFHESHSTPSLIIHESDQSFVKNLYYLSRRLGYTPKYRGGYPIKQRLYFSPKEVQRMSTENAIINPHHIKQITLA